MKIKIDKDGYLWIERAGKMKKQFCPYDSINEGYCGDWCPLFDDSDRKYLCLCNNSFPTTVAVDERGGER
jgi:hypothetical protein